MYKNESKTKTIKNNVKHNLKAIMFMLFHNAGKQYTQAVQYLITFYVNANIFSTCNSIFWTQLISKMENGRNKKEKKGNVGVQRQRNTISHLLKNSRRICISIPMQFLTIEFILRKEHSFFLPYIQILSVVFGRNKKMHTPRCEFRKPYLFPIQYIHIIVLDLFCFAVTERI